MKYFIAIYLVLIVLIDLSFAQQPTTLPEKDAPVPIATLPSPTPKATPNPASIAQTMPINTPVVVVAEPAAPPVWAQDVIMAAQKLPIIGPIVSKIFIYLGIVSSILTALVAFLLTVLSAASKVANISQLTDLANKIELFKDGKIMYWIKYLSMFNAQKPDAPTDQVKPLAKAA